MGINIDLGCGRTTDPDMVLSSSLGLVITMALGGSKGPQICTAAEAAWLMDPKMPGGSPAH